MKDVKKDDVGWTDYGDAYWANFQEDLEGLSSESQKNVGLSIIMALVQGRCRGNPIDIDSVTPISPVPPRKKKKKKEGDDTGSSSSSSSSNSSSTSSSTSSSSNFILVQNGLDTNVDDTTGWIDSDNINQCDDDVADDVAKEFMNRHVSFYIGEQKYEKGKLVAWSPNPVLGWSNPFDGTWRVEFTSGTPDYRASTDVIREALNLNIITGGLPKENEPEERKIFIEIDRLNLRPRKIKRNNPFEFGSNHMLHLFLEVTHRGIAGHGLPNRTFESIKDDNKDNKKEWVKIVELCVPPEVIASPNTKPRTRTRSVNLLIKKLKEQYEEHLLGIEEELEDEDREDNDFTEELDENQTLNDDESMQILTSVHSQEPSDTASTIRDECSSGIRDALGALKEFIDSSSDIDSGPVFALQSMLKKELERLITPGHGRYRRVMMLADTNSGKSTLMNLLGRISEQTQHSGTDGETELKRIILETLLDIQRADALDENLEDEVAEIYEQDHQKIFVEKPNKNEAYVSHDMLEDDKKATEQLMDYHSKNRKVGSTKTASQFLFETGAPGSTTTEVGYGIRFGARYCTVVQYRTEDDMIKEILDYPYNVDDNDAQEIEMRKRMVKLLQTLTGEITKEVNDDEDEDMDSADEADGAFEDDDEIEWPTSKADIKVCVKIQELAGKTYIYPTKGDDQTNDRLYTRKVVKKIAFGTEGNDVRMALSFLTVYAPWAVLEQNIEFREAPGCGDSNPIKIRNLEIELEEADQVVCMMERNLDSFVDGKKYLLSHVLPRYLAAKTLDEWKLESFLRKAKASPETTSFFESVINRVALNELTITQGKAIALDSGSLLDDFIHNRNQHKKWETLKTKPKDLKELIEKCIENVPEHRSKCDKRVELAFISMGEIRNSYTLENILSSEENGIEDLKATGPRGCKPSFMRKATKTNLIAGVASLIAQMPEVQEKSRFEQDALKRLLFSGFSTSYACAWPMLYASVFCARAHGKIDEEEFSLENQNKAQRLSGGADVIRIFMSLPLRQARQCMNRVTTALNDKKILQPLRSWSDSKIPNFVQLEVKKNLKARMKKKFTDDLAETFREPGNPFIIAESLTDADDDGHSHMDFQDDAFDLEQLKEDFAAKIDVLTGKNEADKLQKMRAVFLKSNGGRYRGLGFSVQHYFRKAIISNTAFQGKHVKKKVKSF